MLAALGRKGIGREQRAQMVNDALIAVSAARSGAVVVTANADDFSRIANHFPVRWMNHG